MPKITQLLIRNCFIVGLFWNKGEAQREENSRRQKTIRKAK